MRLFPALVLLMLWSLPAGPAAATSEPSASASVARTAGLQVGSWVLSSASVRLLVAAARSHQPATSEADLIGSLVEDHLLGRHAAAHVGDDHLFEDQRVGYPLAVAAEDKLVAIVERLHAGGLQEALGPGGLTTWIRKRHVLATGELARLLQVPSVRTDDRLDPVRERALGDVPLLDAQFSGDATAVHISLRDVWRRLDVHGRSELYRLSAAFAQAQAQQALRAEFTRRWALRHLGLSATDWWQLCQLMADRERRLALQQVMGAVRGMHAGRSDLVRLRLQVTPAEIARFYAQHPERFERVERVRARHIRCADEASAWQAYAQLQAGQPFGQVACPHTSVAALNSDGDLGWVERPRYLHQWLEHVVFAQPPGPPSTPIREAEARAGVTNTAGWLIVQVLDRQWVRHAGDSETVRFLAADAIVYQRAIDRFEALRERLLRTAVVRRLDTAPGQGDAHW